jgi:tetratricopeptide (TPR) repeat protein
MPRLLKYGDIWAFEIPPEWEFADTKQNRAVDLWQSGELDEAERLFVEVLKKYPDHFDAMNNLACLYNDAGLSNKAMSVWLRLIHLALQNIPREFKVGEDEISWYYNENRSFLRALYNLAVNYFKDGDTTSGIIYANLLLMFCPDDNLGMREYCKNLKVKL